MHEQKSEANVSLIFQRFYDYRMNASDTISAHVTKVEALAKNLKDMGEGLSEKAIIAKIVCTMTEKYKHVISAWNSVSKDEQTLKNLLPRLLNEECIINQWSNDEYKESALTATSKKKKSHSHDSKSIAERKKTSKCGYCKKTGHWQSASPR